MTNQIGGHHHAHHAHYAQQTQQTAQSSETAASGAAQGNAQTAAPDAMNPQDSYCPSCQQPDSGIYSPKMFGQQK